MIELKRCPFCGDEVEIAPTGLYHWKYAIHHKSKTECILDANAFALPYEEEDAIRMWNTRADRKTEPSEHRDCINCEDASDCAKCRGIEDEPQNGYALSKNSEAYKFNKRMEVEEMWLKEQSGKE